MRRPHQTGAGRYAHSGSLPWAPVHRRSFGGKVIGAKEIRHGKLSDIHQKGGDLFEGLPETYRVVRYHSLAVRPEDLPEDLVADAFTDDGEIMALHHKTRPVYGVQFHPESILTEHGHALLKNFLAKVPSAE